MCCHRLCQYDGYINPEYLNKYEITRPLFEILGVFSTWAVCGTRDDVTSTEHWTGLSYEDRKVFGYKCKRIIDMGRIEALKAQGADCRLVYYVDESKSLENMALLATWS